MSNWPFGGCFVEASCLIQAVILLTFGCASFTVEFRWPVPIAVNDSRRRDCKRAPRPS